MISPVASLDMYVVLPVFELIPKMTNQPSFDDPRIYLEPLPRHGMMHSKKRQTRQANSTGIPTQASWTATSKKNAVFGASSNDVGANADYKCLTVEKQNKFFSNTASVLITYPADDIREGSKTARYTQFPRTGNMKVSEDTNSTKNAKYVIETEVRVDRNMKVPVGKLKIEFIEPVDNEEETRAKYGSLGELIFLKEDDDH